MVRLQKQLSRKVGDTEYAKYVVVIPPSAVKEAGFKEGQELKITVVKKKIMLEK